MVTKAIIPGRAVSELHRTGFGEFAVLTVQAVGFGERGATGDCEWGERRFGENW